jgi:hypothetical protein
VISLAVVVIWPGGFQEPALDGVGGGGVVSGEPGAQGGEECPGEDGEDGVEVGLEVEDRFFGGGRPGRDHPGIQDGQERPLVAVRGPCIAFFAMKSPKFDAGRRRRPVIGLLDKADLHWRYRSAEASHRGSIGCAACRVPMMSG